MTIIDRIEMELNDENSTLYKITREEERLEKERLEEVERRRLEAKYRIKSDYIGGILPFGY